jgi:hypothetical protein
MRVRLAPFCTINLIVLAGYSIGLEAQTAAAPTAYTITANNSMAGPVTTAKTYRLGSKVVVDERTPAPVAGGFMNIRTFYDLQKMEKFTWDPVNKSAACVKATFSGDWGDPFAGFEDLAKQGLKQIGAETLHGFTAKIVESAAGPDGQIKAWVDTKTNMVVKAQLTPSGGTPITMTEVTDLSLAPPPASEFAIPANCSTAAALAAEAPTRPPGESEDIAELTGGNGQDYLNGIYGPGSKNSCTMVLRIVHAGTMEPITSGFQVGADLAVATEPPPHYDIHMSRDGHTTFSGGGLHEIVSPTRNGVFRIDDIPAQFEMDIEFGDHGSARANLYRQCFAAQTVLLYIVKDLGDISKGGGWLWAKSGKYSAAPH